MVDRRLDLEIEGVTAILTLTRAPANALDISFLELIADRLNELDLNPNWQVLIITGSDRIFCAGVDLKTLPTLNVSDQDRIVIALNRVYTKLYALNRPTIAAINGHAIAGGYILALCCDYRIASDESSSMGLTEVKVGAPFPISALEIARAEHSPQLFRRVLLFGDLVSTKQAHESGVVDEICPSQRVLERSKQKAQELARLPPQGFAAIKQQMRAATLAILDDALENGNEPQLGGWIGDEAKAAAQRVLAGKA